MVQYPEEDPVWLPGDIGPLKPKDKIFAAVALTYAEARVKLAQTRAVDLVSEFAPGVADIRSIAVASGKAEREAIIFILRAEIG